MSNLQQNEIEQFKREIRLSQDRLKQSKQNKIIAKWAKANLKMKSGPERITKMYDKIQNLFQNEIKQLIRKMNLLQDKLEQFKKRQSLLQKGLK